MQRSIKRRLCLSICLICLISATLIFISSTNNYPETSNVITARLVYFPTTSNQWDQQQNLPNQISHQQTLNAINNADFLEAPSTYPELTSINAQRIPKPFKKTPNFTGCYSSIGTLEAKVPNHDLGGLDFYYPFISTPGWIESTIHYEWKSDQSYPYSLTTLTEKPSDEPQLEPGEERQPEIPPEELQSTEPVKFGPCNFPRATKLVGHKMSRQSEFLSEPTDFEEIVLQNLEVNVGGEWAPIPAGDDTSLSPACPKVAIIIPYRDRQSHLKILLNVLHPMLQRQQIHYQIFVAEQFGQNKFSRGIISNAAFIAVMKHGKFDCIIFQDVDLIPENDYNFYNCNSSPRHFAVGIDKFNYTMPYNRYFGGVLGMTPEHFLLINGYPNTYWGWGGEDDDLYFRTEALNLFISRYSSKDGISRYKMLSHSDEKRRATEFVCELLRTARTRYPLDGISTLQFRLLSIVYEELYTHLLIDVGLPDNVHYESH